MKKIIRLTESDLIKLVKKVIKEQNEQKEKKIIEITNPSQVPQSLVDNPPVVGYYDNHRGSYDKKGQYLEITDENNNTYRLRNSKHGLAGMSLKGLIEADYNSALLTPSKTKSGTIIYAKFGGDGEIDAKDIVANTNDKWIGFDASNRGIKFACFKTIKGEFACYEYGWYS